MYNSKKAQISDTMSWIVATILIVILLSIPVVLVSLDILKIRNACILRGQDPIATKSISGYLLKNYESMGGELSQPAKDNLDSFLKSLSRNEIEKWYSDLNKGEIYKSNRASIEKFYTPFYLSGGNEKVFLEFWVREKIGLGKAQDLIGAKLECR